MIFVGYIIITVGYLMITAGYIMITVGYIMITVLEPGAVIYPHGDKTNTKLRSNRYFNYLKKTFIRSFFQFYDKPILKILMYF